MPLFNAAAEWQAVSTATGRRGVRRTRTSTVPWRISGSSAAALVLSGLILRSHPATDRVLWATEQISAARCRPWTVTTTPTCAVKPVRLTIPALKVVVVNSSRLSSHTPQ